MALAILIPYRRSPMIGLNFQVIICASGRETQRVPSIFYLSKLMQLGVDGTQ
ncbi:hypothetical protein I3760_13G082400 [Carya illinoinensis]|uniref:Uncharacterized protein n=1 Tax=Carya illinoinensis TaxID=32201 RepID=A0A8T1NHJ5_CARIL|nr:hypothetical protein I3760_13G082400 [Carya illinoinensis]KAG6631326.1 hypothetical protein CIPAW_13G083900 [Carya illinoinensis]